ncbi:hypothetical protein RC62_1933 [Flavobacterium aquidurense]|uniref:Uncharacterized protein n=1 Tax=Flavobacterium aquidurense TaxID=362413 RepID=A0A0Q0RQA9_9FLAO|nr:hypothetical protein RC62_1933 [Flavobacterium aquidurense]
MKFLFYNSLFKTFLPLKISDNREIGFYPDVYDRDVQLYKLLYSDAFVVK